MTSAEPNTAPTPTSDNYSTAHRSLQSNRQEALKIAKNTLTDQASDVIDERNRAEQEMVKVDGGVREVGRMEVERPSTRCVDDTFEYRKLLI